MLKLSCYGCCKFFCYRLLADKAQFSHPQQDFTSLFESRSLTRVPHWTLEKVELQKPEFESSEEISSVSAEQTETRIEVTSTKEEEKEEEEEEDKVLNLHDNFLRDTSLIPAISGVLTCFFILTLGAEISVANTWQILGRFHQ